MVGVVVVDTLTHDTYKTHNTHIYVTIEGKVVDVVCFQWIQVISWHRLITSELRLWMLGTIKHFPSVSLRSWPTWVVRLRIIRHDADRERDSWDCTTYIYAMVVHYVDIASVLIHTVHVLWSENIEHMHKTYAYMKWFYGNRSDKIYTKCRQII